MLRRLLRFGLSLKDDAGSAVRRSGRYIRAGLFAKTQGGMYGKAFLLGPDEAGCVGIALVNDTAQAEMLCANGRAFDDSADDILIGCYEPAGLLSRQSAPEAQIPG